MSPARGAGRAPLPPNGEKFPPACIQNIKKWVLGDQSDTWARTNRRMYAAGQRRTQRGKTDVHRRGFCTCDDTGGRWMIRSSPIVSLLTVPWITRVPGSRWTRLAARPAHTGGRGTAPGASAR